MKVSHTFSGVLTLTFDRPEVGNAFNQDVLTELHQQIKSAEQNPDIRCILLTGEGKHFCTGGDLNYMKASIELSKEENQQQARELADTLTALYTCSKPIIAHAKGACFGGGVGILACCDVVFAESNTQACLSEIKVGLVPATISPFVIEAIGARQARRYFISAEVMNAETAQSLGLIHEILQEGKQTSQLEAFFDQLNQAGPEAITACKRLIQTVSHKSPSSPETSSYTAQLIADIRCTDEAQEGMDAFLNKRLPSWRVSK